MLEFLSEHLDLPKERILRAACIDPAEFDDTLAFEILGIPLPKKHEDGEHEIEEEKEEGAVMHKSDREEADEENEEVDEL